MTSGDPVFGKVGIRTVIGRSMRRRRKLGIILGRGSDERGDKTIEGEEGEIGRRGSEVFLRGSCSRSRRDAD